MYNYILCEYGGCYVEVRDSNKEKSWMLNSVVLDIS